MASDRASPLQGLKASALNQSDRTEELLCRDVESLQSFNQVLPLLSLCMYNIAVADIERAEAALHIQTFGNLVVWLHINYLE